MLIVDVFMGVGAIFLLACSILCVFAIRQGQGRRKLRERRRSMLNRMLGIDSVERRTMKAPRGIFAPFSRVNPEGQALT
jgi:hypothetical protein